MDVDEFMFYVRLAGAFFAVGGVFAGISIMVGHVLFSVLRMMEGGN